MYSVRTNLGIVVAVCLITLAGTLGSPRAAIEGKQIKAAPEWLGLFGVAMRPDGSIFAVGSKALLMASTDHGNTWTQQILKERPGSELFQDRDLYSIRFAPDGKAGWIVGEEGTVLHSVDGGQTWTPQKAGTTKNLFKVAVVDDQTAVAVGADGTIVRTTDGGSTWETLKSPKMIGLYDVTFTDKNDGWIAGEFSSILHSTDGGKTWNLAYGGNTGDFTIGPFFTVVFTNPQHGIAAGLAGDLLETSDGGKTWKPAKLPDAVPSYVIALNPADNAVWTGGNGGKMFSLNSAGQWKEMPRSTFHDLTDIAFAGKNGVAVGLNGTILLTDDAGEKWQAVQ